MEYTLYQLLWFFLIYAFLGWLCETALAAARLRRLINRGFLNIPFSPIYGLAAVLFASILNGQGDKPTMELILEKMRALKAEQTQTQTFSEADIEYLNTLITLTAERMEKLS